MKGQWPQSYCVVGTKVTPLHLEAWNQFIVNVVTSSGRCIIASQNVHGVYMYHRNKKMRDLHARPETVVHIDGMPLILIGRLFGVPLMRAHRLTWVDWLVPLLDEARKRGWRAYYLGAKPGVAEAGARTLREELPGLDLAVGDGYFSSGTIGNDARIEEINASGCKLLIVGMGMPFQEEWILDNLHRLDPPVILTAGAAIEYFAGVVRTPPRWMGQWGLEWLIRLSENPARFWRRYLLEPWFVVWLICKQAAFDIRRAWPRLFHRNASLDD